MILPERTERAIVVFRFFPSLGYETRLRISFLMLAAGVFAQVLTGSFVYGVAFLVLGNLLLIVKGYDNRVDFASFDPDAHWERSDVAKLDELERLDRKIRSWDKSLLDITSPLGALLLLLLAGGLGIMAVMLPGYPQIFALDALVLLLPHWVTGIRKILRRPKLMVRILAIDAVLKEAEPLLRDHTVSLMMLLRGDETKLPEDVKFKVDLEEHKEGFLGLYGQVVINDVQGASYPYFYVVLVARKGYGLADVHGEYDPPLGLTKEFKEQDEVEVLILRQTTSKTSGYHTDTYAAARIFSAGLELARKVALVAVHAGPESTE